MNRLQIFFSLLLVIASGTGIGQIRLPKLISDGVILQRDEKVHMWGWASPNEEITLLFKSQTYTTKADENGDWMLILPSQNAGGPYEITLKGQNEIRIKNVLFGDVWVCSGQSNMELPLERLKEKYGEVIKNATNTNIRQFLVPDTYNFKNPQTDFNSGSWVAANPESILEFSGVGYFFAHKLYEKYHVPIGFINTALGGSPIEAWLSNEALKAFPESYNEAQKYKDASFIKEIEAGDKKRSDAWYTLANTSDEGLLEANQWKEASADDQDWKTMDIPGYWSDQTSLGHMNGVVWFRKEVEVPSTMVGKPAKLFMGRIVDQDFVYVNGTLAGTTGYQYPPRRYDLAPTLLKEGKNTIAIRVINNSGKGGFVLDKPYFLAVGKDTIDLKGPWKYQLGATMAPLAGPTFIRWKPEGLYNAMIAPLINFKIKGVLWYQGESNTGEPEAYAQTLPALIYDWRNKWHKKELPFLFVQLPNFMEAYPEPRESNWAQLRQSQLETLSVPYTGMAVTIDVGEWNDIHPLNKEAVGSRLALLARKIAYHETEINAFSPSPKKAKFKVDKVLISFKHTGKGLIASDGKDLKCFAISNDGEKFVWAKAQLKGDTIEVWNDHIKNPSVVRYAWANNPENANLATQEGLPATPFEIKKK